MSAPSMLKRCFSGVPGMLQRCFRHVSDMFQKCFRNVLEMIQAYLKDALAMFLVCFLMFQICFKDFSAMFSRLFQRCLWDCESNDNENSEVCLGPFQHFVLLWAPFWGPFSNRDSADDSALHTVGPGACFGDHFTLIVARTNVFLFIFVLVSVCGEIVEKCVPHHISAKPAWHSQACCDGT